MIYLKSCPRCGGDVILDHDQYGWFKSCIQCGYYVDEKPRSKETVHANQ